MEINVATGKKFAKNISIYEKNQLSYNIQKKLMQMVNSSFDQDYSKYFTKYVYENN